MISFASDVQLYVGRVRLFDRRDWAVYVAWVGLMLGMTGTALFFALAARAAHAPVPKSIWLLPFGAAIFSAAIAFDTIGHRTVYKTVIARAERLVHAITIFCGIGSSVLLCAAYSERALFLMPAAVLTVLSFVYSFVDEAFHWHRYFTQKSDPVEMWSHVFILVGHGILMGSWWVWVLAGYPGVAETLAFLGARG